MKRSKTQKRNTVLFVLLGLILAVVIAGALYIHDYYHADQTAMAVVETAMPTVSITKHEGKQIAFIPDEPVAGLIFYPGGKVQYEAYAPLMEKLAENGILCILVHMPGNLAVLDSNAADDIAKAYPDIDRWYIGGHSLGGAMAASYASKHSDAFAGLILLAAYSTEDITDSGLQVLSVYGTEDGVLNRDAYQDNLPHLPDTTTECVIQGGCHAYFGSYGAQDGDGTPTISLEEQLTQTADAITNMVLGNG